MEAVLDEVVPMGQNDSAPILAAYEYQEAWVPTTKTLVRMSDVESQSLANWLTTDWYPDDSSQWS